MKKDLFILGVTLLASARSAPTWFETVWLKDVTTRFSSDKRTFSDHDHPDELTFNLRRGSGDITLNLKRNYDINPNADIYFARKSKDGQSVLVKTANFGNKDVAYYQDMENGAFVTVRCVKRLNEQCDRAINGNIQIGDSCYDLRPAETEVTSRNFFEVPDLFAKQYVLQDQAYIQRENSFENKGNVNEKKVEQELTALFRRFEGQHKQNNVSRSDATLSSRNIIPLYTRAATDKSRQLRKYYVKIAVLIESGTWALYSSMVNSFNPLTKSRNVKRKIQESYSHIMNGVNLRYKGIRDSSISISIILSRFIYFKLKSDFNHKESTVISSNGKNYINSTAYITDLSSWDKDIGKKYAPSYDHGMLFTRYHLYDRDIRDTTSGIAINRDVCEVGGRLSIIEATDYFSTSMKAAHELGHNLGANHDGEGDATDCKAQDLFIMTTEEPNVHPDKPFPSNFWLFSSCSVEAFKRNLKDRKCVHDPGAFYDEKEYNEYVKKLPGEVYEPDVQCHVINGPGSVSCSFHPPNRCYLKCTDPGTTKCKNTFYYAARGTPCGVRKAQTEACDTQPCTKSNTLQDLPVGYLIGKLLSYFHLRQISKHVYEFNIPIHVY